MDHMETGPWQPTKAQGSSFRWQSKYQITGELIIIRTAHRTTSMLGESMVLAQLAREPSYCWILRSLDCPDSMNFFGLQSTEKKTVSFSQTFPREAELAAIPRKPIWQLGSSSTDGNNKQKLDPIGSHLVLTYLHIAHAYDFTNHYLNIQPLWERPQFFVKPKTWKHQVFIIHLSWLTF